MADTASETLFLLKSSSECLLNTLYFAYKTSSSPKHRPSFLSQKALEPLLKKVAKRFPIGREFLAKENCSELTKQASQILDEVQPFYDALTNLINFKDSLVQLLRCLQGNIKVDLIAHADVSLNLLRAFTTLVRAFLLMNSIEDLSKIVGAYGLAFQSINSTQEFAYINICRMIIEHAVSSKKLNEDFKSYEMIFIGICSSLVDEFRLLYVDGRQLESTCRYNLSASSQTISVPNHNHIPELQLCGCNIFCQWFIYVGMIFPQLFTHPTIEPVTNLVFSTTVLLPLHRDTSISLSKEVIPILESVKGLNKKAKELISCLQAASTTFIEFHMKRRDHFIHALQEACYILSDQPGILGPKLDRVLQLLSFAFDAAHFWFLHFSCDAFKSKKVTAEVFDISVLSLVHSILVLRGLIFKYSKIITKYYSSFVTEYDAKALEHIQTQIDLGKFSLDEADTACFAGFRALCPYLRDNPLSDDGERTDVFVAMRFDWHRVQFRSVLGSKNFANDIDSCDILNNMAYHTRALDDLNALVDECAPIYTLWFFRSTFTLLLHELINSPAPKSFASVCYGVYADYNSYLDKLCPEERYILADNCLSGIDQNLQTVASVCVAAFSTYWHELREATSNLCVTTVVNSWLRRYCESRRDIAAKLKLPPPDVPGDETVRVLRNQGAELTKGYTNLQSCCEALCRYHSIHVLDHHFFPRQAVLPHLETFILNEFTSMIRYWDTSGEKTVVSCPTRPSVLLKFVKDLQHALSILGSMLDLKIDPLYYSCLLSLSAPPSTDNGPSFAAFYATWYVETLLELDFLSGIILYSPIRRSFVSKSSVPFKVEEHTDMSELRCLVRILGPYGMKIVSDALNKYICTQMAIIKKFINTLNKGFLDNCLEGTAGIEAILKKDKTADEVVSALTKAGAAMVLKSLLMSALQNAVDDISHHVSLAMEYLKPKMLSFDQTVPRIFAALGYESPFDLELYGHLVETILISDGDRELWVENFPYLFLFVVAYVALRVQFEYLPQVAAFTNNLHVVVTVFRTMIPLIHHHYECNSPKAIEEAMSSLCHRLSSLVIKIFDGTLFTSVVRGSEAFFLLINLLCVDNPFVKDSTIEKLVPSCLVVSATDKLIRSKFTSRGAKKTTNT